MLMGADKGALARVRRGHNRAGTRGFAGAGAAKWARKRDRRHDDAMFSYRVARPHNPSDRRRRNRRLVKKCCYFADFGLVFRSIFCSGAPMRTPPRAARDRIVSRGLFDSGGPGPRGCCVLPAKTRSFSRPFWPPIERGEASAARSAAKMASKMGAFLPAHHNNRGDPGHQNRTRPRTRYGLALCAGASPSVRANIK